jgi:SAM-dependent methyltransferase
MARSGLDQTETDAPAAMERKTGGFRGWADKSFRRAMDLNLENIVALLQPGKSTTALLDLGCDDGALTVRFAARIGTQDVHGVEIVEERAEEGRRRGIEVRSGDLNDRLPYADESFDVVTSNQVIEHLARTDNFVSEIFRVLKPGGYAVTSTENLASWHNIAALSLGWQPFSLSNVSRVLGLGNPLAIHRASEHPIGDSWQHLRVFAYRGLCELFTEHGYEVEKALGAGYFPLPARTARVDPRHAAFLAVKTRKPVGN